MLPLLLFCKMRLHVVPVDINASVAYPLQNEDESASTFPLTRFNRQRLVQLEF
jgi:hypothetical protein